MTVAELIEELSQHEPSAEVLLQTWDTEWAETFYSTVSSDSPVELHGKRVVIREGKPADL